jgi:hypothetical protein
MASISTTGSMRKEEKERESLQGVRLVRVICRRISEPVALTNELPRPAEKDCLRRKRTQKSRRRRGEDERGSRGMLDVAEIEYHAF